MCIRHLRIVTSSCCCHWSVRGIYVIQSTLTLCALKWHPPIPNRAITPNAANLKPLRQPPCGEKENRPPFRGTSGRAFFTQSERCCTRKVILKVVVIKVVNMKRMLVITKGHYKVVPEIYTKPARGLSTRTLSFACIGASRNRDLVVAQHV